jgi:hypothetical protein
MSLRDVQITAAKQPQADEDRKKKGQQVMILGRKKEL